MIYLHDFVDKQTSLIIGSYLVCLDSIQFDCIPIEPPSRVTANGKYWYTLTSNKLYYGEVKTENGKIKRVWYDQCDAQPRASKCESNPICWLDSGSLEKPHRIGSPAYGDEYYIDGFRVPVDIGQNFKIGQWYSMYEKDGVLLFGPGPINIKYMNNILIINGGPTSVQRLVGGGWGMAQTLKSFLINGNDTGALEYLGSKKVRWGYKSSLLP